MGRLVDILTAVGVIFVHRFSLQHPSYGQKEPLTHLSSRPNRARHTYYRAAPVFCLWQIPRYFWVSWAFGAIFRCLPCIRNTKVNLINQLYICFIQHESDFKTALSVFVWRMVQPIERAKILAVALHRPLLFCFHSGVLFGHLSVYIACVTVIGRITFVPLLSFLEIHSIHPTPTWTDARQASVAFFYCVYTTSLLDPFPYKSMLNFADDTIVPAFVDPLLLSQHTPVLFRPKAPKEVTLHL